MSSANEIEVNVTIEAEAVLRDANAMKLATSISKIEGVREINLHVLKGLGLGGDTAVRFCDLTNEPHMAASARAEYVGKLIDADDELWELGDDSDGEAEHSRTTHLAVARAVTAIVDSLKVSETAPTPVKDSSGFVLTAQTEEERAFSVPGYDMSDKARAEELLVKMFNLRLRPHFTPIIATQKKIQYWLTVEYCFPDMTRLKWSKFEIDKGDTMLLKVKRLINGVMLGAAGEKCREG